MLIPRFIKSTKYAVTGVFYALRTERNVQIWFGVMLSTLLLSWWLMVDRNEFLFIFISLMVIGVSEYLNTSIEILSDRVTTERDEQIKHVKDIAAGATFIASTTASITSIIILLPKLLEKFGIYF